MDVKMKSLVFNSLDCLRKNFFLLLLVSFSLQLFLLIVGKGVLSLGFKLILWVARQDNLNKDNLHLFFLQPFSLLSVLLFLIVFAFFVFLEHGVMYILLYSCVQKVRIGFRSILKNALDNIKVLWGVDFFFFFLYLLSVIPISNFFFSTELLAGVYIPDFITLELSKTPLGATMLALVGLVLLYVHFRMLFVLPLMIFNEKTFRENVKISFRCTQKGKIKLLSTLFLLNGVVLVLSVLLLLVFFFVTENVFSFLGSSVNISSFFGRLEASRQVSYVQNAGEWIVVLLFQFLKMLMVSVFKLVNTLPSIFLLSPHIEEKLYPRVQERYKYMKTAVCTLALVFVLFFSYESIQIFSTWTKPALHQVALVAHRGYASLGVENSIEALEAASAYKADYVEVDLLLTKDGKFVVGHDENLARLAKIKKKVSESTLEELVGLPIYQGDFESQIVSFETFYQRAKALKMKLLIELKPIPKNEAIFAEKFLEEYERLNISDETEKVMSLSLSVMESLNQKRPSMQTGYVIPLQIGSFAKNDVDFYVIEDFSFKDSLLQQAKEEKKALYVWTINDEDKMREYLQKDIDGIITDDLSLAQMLKTEN